MEIENENRNCSLSAPLACRGPNVRCGSTNTTLPGRHVRSTIRLPGWCRYKPRIADSRLLAGLFAPAIRSSPVRSLVRRAAGFSLPGGSPDARPQADVTTAHEILALVLLFGVEPKAEWRLCMHRLSVPTTVRFGWAEVHMIITLRRRTVRHCVPSDLSGVQIFEWPHNHL
jgi:hypothetical protein